MAAAAAAAAADSATSTYRVAGASAAGGAPAFSGNAARATAGVAAGVAAVNEGMDESEYVDSGSGGEAEAVEEAAAYQLRTLPTESAV